MTFLFPIGLAFLALLPVVVIFHMLRTRRPPMEFSSTYLWQQLAHESTGRVSWRPPIPSLLLLLQLLIVALLALALAQPALTSAAPPQTALLIVDTSASMQATDVPGGRLAQAKKAAANIIDKLNASDRAIIIKAGATASVVGESRDRYVLLGALNALEAEGGTADMRGALMLAGALGAGHANPTVYVFSDGGFKTTDLPAISAKQVQQAPIGARSFNQAIVTAIARPAFTSGGQYELFARLANFADQAVEVPVQATADGVLFDRRFVNLPARGQVEMILRIPLGAKSVEVRIDARDDLAVDNNAQLTLPAGEVTRVTLVSDVPEPIERVLKLIPNTKVDVVKPASYRPDQTSDVTIFDAAVPSQLPSRGNVLIVNPRQSVPGLINVTGELSWPVPNRWDAQSPLLTSVDPAALPIARAVQIDQPRWARVIAQAGQYPLMLQGVDQSRKIVVFAFDLSSGDLTQRIAFPLLIYNAVTWLSPGNLPQSVAPGTAVDLAPPAGATGAVVQQPNGRTETLQAKPDGQPIQYLATDQIGAYSVIYRSADQEFLRQRFTVNVLSDAESNLAVQKVAFPTTPPAAVDSAEVSAQSTASYLWPLLTLLALGLLGVEWWGARRWA